MNKYEVTISLFGTELYHTCVIGTRLAPDAENFESIILVNALEGYYPKFIAPYEDNPRIPEDTVENIRDMYYGQSKISRIRFLG